MMNIKKGSIVRLRNGVIAEIKGDKRLSIFYYNGLGGSVECLLDEKLAPILMKEDFGTERQSPTDLDIIEVLKE